MTTSVDGYRRLTLASGYWDIVVMLPFLLPGVATLVLELVARADDSLGLPGSVEPFAPFHTLFVNMLAALTIVWSVKRVRTPEPVLGLYDGISRVLLAALMVGHMALGASLILVGFVVAEIVWASLQLTGYRRVGRERG